MAAVARATEATACTRSVGGPGCGDRAPAAGASGRVDSVALSAVEVQLDASTARFNRLKPGHPAGSPRVLPQRKSRVSHAGQMTGDAAHHTVVVGNSISGTNPKAFSYHARLRVRSLTGSFTANIPCNAACPMTRLLRQSPQLRYDDAAGGGTRRGRRRGARARRGAPRVSLGAARERRSSRGRVVRRVRGRAAGPGRCADHGRGGIRRRRPDDAPLQR